MIRATWMRQAVGISTAETRLLGRGEMPGRQVPETLPLGDGSVPERALTGEFLKVSAQLGGSPAEARDERIASDPVRQKGIEQLQKHMKALSPTERPKMLTELLLGETDLTRLADIAGVVLRPEDLYALTRSENAAVSSRATFVLARILEVGFDERSPERFRLNGKQVQESVEYIYQSTIRILALPLNTEVAAENYRMAMYSLRLSVIFYGSLLTNPMAGEVVRKQARERLQGIQKLTKAVSERIEAYLKTLGDAARKRQTESLGTPLDYLQKVIAEALAM